MTVGELLERMSSAEITEWAGYLKWQDFERKMAESS